jgi:hypothetical protein
LLRSVQWPRVRIGRAIFGCRRIESDGTRNQRQPQKASPFRLKRDDVFAARQYDPTDVGCHSSYYRKRCLVCEQPMERKTERQLICGKRLCRNGLQARSDLGRYHASSAVVSALKTLDSIDSKPAPATDRGIDWAIAVNQVGIRAPRRVLDAVFGRVPLMQPEPELLAA